MICLLLFIELTNEVIAKIFSIFLFGMLLFCWCSDILEAAMDVNESRMIAYPLMYMSIQLKTSI